MLLPDFEAGEQGGSRVLTRGRGERGKRREGEEGEDDNDDDDDD